MLNSLLDPMTVDECRERFGESSKGDHRIWGNAWRFLLTCNRRRHLSGLLSHHTTVLQEFGRCANHVMPFPNNLYKGCFNNFALQWPGAAVSW